MQCQNDTTQVLLCVKTLIICGYLVSKLRIYSLRYRLWSEHQTPDELAYPIQHSSPVRSDNGRFTLYRSTNITLLMILSLYWSWWRIEQWMSRDIIEQVGTVSVVLTAMLNTAVEIFNSNSIHIETCFSFTVVNLLFEFPLHFGCNCWHLFLASTHPLLLILMAKIIYTNYHLLSDVHLI